MIHFDKKVALAFVVLLAGYLFYSLKTRVQVVTLEVNGPDQANLRAGLTIPAGFFPTNIAFEVPQHATRVSMNGSCGSQQIGILLLDTAGSTGEPLKTELYGVNIKDPKPGTWRAQIINDSSVSCQLNLIVQKKLAPQIAQAERKNPPGEQSFDFLERRGPETCEVQGSRLDVDPLVTDLNVHCYNCGEVQIFDPDGKLVQSGNSGASESNFSDQIVWQVVEPKSGSWTIKCTAKQNARLLVSGSTSAGVAGFELQPLGQKDRTTGEVVSGQVSPIRVLLSNSSAKATIDILSTSASVLATYELKPSELNSNRSDHMTDFEGLLPIPEEEFGIKISFQSKDGQSISRPISQKWIPRQVQIVNKSRRELKRDSPTTFEAEVFNRSKQSKLFEFSLDQSTDKTCLKSITSGSDMPTRYEYRDWCQVPKQCLETLKPKSAQLNPGQSIKISTTCVVGKEITSNVGRFRLWARSPAKPADQNWMDWHFEIH